MIKPIDLNYGEFGGLELPKLKVDFNSDTLQTYPSANDERELRKEIKKKLLEENDVFAEDDEIFIFPGSYVLLSLITARFDCCEFDNDDEHQWPGYAKIDNSIREYNGYDLLCVSSPRNPTGKVLDYSSFLEHRNREPVLVDHAYEHFQDKQNRIPANLEGVAHLFSFSKSYFIPGLRLCYVYSRSEEWKKLLKTAHDQTGGSASKMVLDYGTQVLKVRNSILYTHARLNMMQKVKFLADCLGLEHPEGGMFLYIPVKSCYGASYVAEALKDRGFLVNANFGSDHIRVCPKASEDTLMDFVEAFREIDTTFS